MIIRYQIVHSDNSMRSVERPTRANPSDAGLDVFFNPQGVESEVTIEPGKNALLQTGVRFEIPHGYMLQVCNRSGVAAKRGLVAGAHIVDAGFSGQVFIDLHNIGTAPQTVRAGDKIAQLVMLPVIHFRAVESDEIYDTPLCISNRGEGALGSTDKK